MNCRRLKKIHCMICSVKSKIHDKFSSDSNRDGLLTYRINWSSNQYKKRVIHNNKVNNILKVEPKLAHKFTNVKEKLWFVFSHFHSIKQWKSLPKPVVPIAWRTLLAFLVDSGLVNSMVTYFRFESLQFLELLNIWSILSKSSWQLNVQDSLAVVSRISKQVKARFDSWTAKVSTIFSQFSNEPKDIVRILVVFLNSDIKVIRFYWLLKFCHSYVFYSMRVSNIILTRDFMNQTPN